jgi:hypothetical protein
MRLLHSLPSAFRDSPLPNGHRWCENNACQRRLKFSIWANLGLAVGAAAGAAAWYIKTSLHVSETSAASVWKLDAHMRYHSI